jgi:ribosomal protein S18 acetylase RimI-like enzyme
MQIRAFQLADEEAVIRVWRECGLVRAVNDPHKDICRKLAVRPDLFLVGIVEDQVVAVVMAGYDGHRGWLNYLGVLPAFRKRGFARLIVSEAERLLRLEGCAKINLQVRTENQGVIDFYRRIGYVTDDVLSMGKRLEKDQ